MILLARIEAFVQRLMLVLVVILVAPSPTLFRAAQFRHLCHIYRIMILRRPSTNYIRFVNMSIMSPDITIMLPLRLLRRLQHNRHLLR